MIGYYDTGLLKLYPEEKESDAIRAFVREKKRPLAFTSLHMSECVSALRLKCFRREHRTPGSPRGRPATGGFTIN